MFRPAVTEGETGPSEPEPLDTRPLCAAFDEPHRNQLHTCVRLRARICCRAGAGASRGGCPSGTGQVGVHPPVEFAALLTPLCSLNDLIPVWAVVVGLLFTWRIRSSWFRSWYRCRTAASVQMRSWRPEPVLQVIRGLSSCSASLSLCLALRSSQCRCAALSGAA